MRFPDERIAFGLWGVIAIAMLAFAAYFYLGKSSAASKRVVFRWFIVIGGILVNAWFALLMGVGGLLVGIPLYVVSALLCAKTTRFCDACGAAHMNRYICKRYCGRCGADMDAQDEQRRAVANNGE